MEVLVGSFLIILKYIIGWVLTVIGAIGFFIPLPFVPFFLLFFLGLHMIHKDKWWSEKLQKLMHHDDDSEARK
jgi:uncharacterized membrane protein YbaN (DUF454 family)